MHLIGGESFAEGCDDFFSGGHPLVTKHFSAFKKAVEVFFEFEDFSFVKA